MLETHSMQGSKIQVLEVINDVNRVEQILIVRVRFSLLEFLKKFQSNVLSKSENAHSLYL